MVLDVAVRLGIKVNLALLVQSNIRKPELVLIFCVQGALRSTVTGKSETRRISRWLFAGDVGKRSSRTFKAFSAVLDTCPVPVRGGRRSSLLNNRRHARTQAHALAKYQSAYRQQYSHCDSLLSSHLQGQRQLPEQLRNRRVPQRRCCSPRRQSPALADMNPCCRRSVWCCVVARACAS
jgi:hypothetical protein